MMLDTLPRLHDPSTTNDNSLDHLFCCNPNIALCGADISDEEDVGDDDLDDPCPMCELLIDMPCGAAGCPDA